MLYRPSSYPGLRLRSVARLYPSGVNLVTQGRPDLLYIRIQNRGNQAVHFWHGLVPSGSLGDGPFLPADPNDWTPTELADAEEFIGAYGERIATSEKWEPTVAHTGPVYSYVSSGTNKSHVVVGLQGDQEQGAGSWQERQV